MPANSPCASKVLRKIVGFADPDRAVFLQRFFKTGSGGYAEGDVFLGLTVPMTRTIARQFRGLPIHEVRELLTSKFHEVRLAALFMLVAQFEIGDDRTRKGVYTFYLKQTSRVNNWDLVDGSAPQIVGGWLSNRSRRRLHHLAKSKNLWERRIAMIATYRFIKQGDLDETFALADVLIADQHDLMHKAVGWMLREAGKRDRANLEDWLKTRYRRMPRTMLRGSIEKFPPALRQDYLRGRI